MRDEREARASFLLGMLLAEAGVVECASELLGEAVETDPGLIAARVELGFVLGRDEDYVGMLEVFREAVRLDAGAVRQAVRKEPAEMGQLRQLLRPDASANETSEQGQPAFKSAMPAQFQEANALVTLAREYVGTGGRDGEAAQALERALQLDETYWYAMALLALAHLLIRADGGTAPTDGEGSVLWEAEPALARLLFKERKSTSTISH